MTISAVIQRFNNRIDYRTIAPSLLFCSFCHFSSAALSPGDLVITEVMANPAAVSDTKGEWFEIYNPTNSAIDLNGLILRDNASNQHTVNSASSLLINAGGYFVFGRSGDSAVNGGYDADYVYNNFSLGNTADDIILQLGDTIIASLIYNDPMLGTAGNSVEVDGQSLVLTPDTFRYGDGDIGTPGMRGSTAPVSAVPLPAAGWLMATALSSMLVIRRKNRAW